MNCLTKYPLRVRFISTLQRVSTPLSNGTSLAKECRLFTLGNLNAVEDLFEFVNYICMSVTACKREFIRFRTLVSFHLKLIYLSNVYLYDVKRTMLPPPALCST